MSSKPADVDEYIRSLGPDVQPVVRAVRQTILDAVPGSTEVIRYDMPAVLVDGGYLVHYAGWKRHVALYPIPRFDADGVDDGGLEAAVAPLRSGKDTVRFMLDRPLPCDLLTRIVEALLRRRGPAPTPSGPS